MAKKSKVKKTLVDQILDKAKIDHDSLSFNGLEGELPEDVARESIYKTLALKGDKTGPVIGIIPITEHLSEKKLAKISGNKKVQMIPQKDLQKTTGYVHGANNPVGIRQKHNFPIYILYATVKLNGIWKDASKVPRETPPFLKNLLSKSVSLAITSVILISTWSYQVTYHALKKQLNSSWSLKKLKLKLPIPRICVSGNWGN